MLPLCCLLADSYRLPAMRRRVQTCARWARHLESRLQCRAAQVERRLPSRGWGCSLNRWCDLLGFGPKNVRSGAAGGGTTRFVLHPAPCDRLRQQSRRATERGGVLATRSVFRKSSRGLRVGGPEIGCAEMGGRAVTSLHRVLARANRADTDSSVYINNPVVCKRRHFCVMSFVEDALINRHRQSYPIT